MRISRATFPLVVWAAVLVAGIWWQMRYAQTPGEALAAPSVWNAVAGLARRPGYAAVIMAVHPLCPCTRESLLELREFADFAATRDMPVDLYVLVCAPKDAVPEWTESGNCVAAKTLPGVTVIVDTGAALARAFGMRTSGHVVAYDTDGRLAFSGGITPLRGEIGDNPGLAALKLLGTKPVPMSAQVTPFTTPVFGCELVGRASGDLATVEDKP